MQQFFENVSVKVFSLRPDSALEKTDSLGLLPYYPPRRGVKDQFSRLSFAKIKGKYIRDKRLKASLNKGEQFEKETDHVDEGHLENKATFVESSAQPGGPSKSGVPNDKSGWEINKAIPEVPTESRVRSWAINLEEIINDPLGVQELLQYMKKEYSHENLRFWLAVQELKHGPGSDTKIRKKVKEIFEEFLSQGAQAEVNIDAKTMEETRFAMQTPSRFTYDKAEDHVYLLLLKRDCYPRFIRSEHFKALLEYTINPRISRKRLFNFSLSRKKTSHKNASPVPFQPSKHTQSLRNKKPLQDQSEDCLLPDKNEKDVERTRKISKASYKLDKPPPGENNASKPILTVPFSSDFLPLEPEKTVSDSIKNTYKVRKSSYILALSSEDLIVNEQTKTYPIDRQQTFDASAVMEGAFE